jgi:tetratricopeptide (TPR) repeat protein
MMFGRLPEPPPDAPNAPNKTLAFGVPVVSAAPVLDLEPAGAERTVRVELDGVSGGGPDGTPLRPVDSGPARHDRTALFAMSESDTASTQRQEATPADGAITLPPQAHVAGAENLFSTQKYDVGLPASTLPAMPPLRDVADLSNPAPIKLSMLSETDLASVAGTVPERQALSSQDFSADSEAAAIANAGRRRNMIALAVVSVLVVVAGVAAGWMIFGKQLLAPQVSPSIRAAVEQSVSKLRVDDRSTRAAEVARLEKIIKEIPQFSEAHAALVVALALEFDDLHAENSAIVARYKPLRAKFDALDDATKARPEGRKIGGAVNALVDQQKALSERDRVLREKVEKAQRAMEAAVAEVEPGPSGELAVLRARALVKAISGSAAARELAAKGGGDDYWLKLVPASLALNVEGTPKGELEAALASLDGLRNSDETAGFPRPHFLAARLFVALGDKEKAMAALDKSLKVSPDYAPAVSVKKLLAGWEP